MRKVQTMCSRWNRCDVWCVMCNVWNILCHVTWWQNSLTFSFLKYIRCDVWHEMCEVRCVIFVMYHVMWLLSSKSRQSKYGGELSKVEFQSLSRVVLWSEVVKDGGMSVDIEVTFGAAYLELPCILCSIPTITIQIYSWIHVSLSHNTTSTIY